MSRYAKDSSVPADRSRSEIERELRRFGADGFGYSWEGTKASIFFRLQGRYILFEIALPPKDVEEFKLTPSKKWERHPQDQQAAWEKAVRARWRALALVVKAKLVAVDSGISSVEEEFLAWIVLPDKSTAGQFLIPQIDAAYKSGTMPPLLTMNRGDAE